MPQITVKDGITFEAETGKRLILALEDAGVDILHRCGGYAKCTTCRVKFMAGEPDKMTVAERDRLSESEGLLGDVRLSCQIPCDHDMTVEPLMSKASMNLDDAGSRPQDQITPEPEWIDRPA
jgi:ferredoxin